MDEKAAIEKMNLSKQLDDDDCTVMVKIIDTMFTKKSSKDFFSQNIAAFYAILLYYKIHQLCL